MESQDASTSTSSTPTSSLPMKPSRAVTVPAFAAAAQLQSRVPHSKVTNPSSAVTNTSGAKTTAGSFINIRRGIPPSVPPRPRVVAPSSTTGRPNSAHSSSKLTESRLP
ncbi:hypothetical protein NEOLEDRAFT_1142194 [Neolentinus lepideus HHB14362 ss-1]|uniref:Uncharacterized protein n=1 Tax=Neolentinus lepideus HHB14362 ss-1 TaxID=1314782 RepID=A0A165N9H1_9AGAM|nr:hypothetical protein NEOLEDRAFT_1142194 [Neolentinus lepideus HHB14362 ss-1]